MTFFFPKPIPSVLSAVGWVGLVGVFGSPAAQAGTASPVESAPIESMQAAAVGDQAAIAPKPGTFSTHAAALQPDAIAQPSSPLDSATPPLQSATLSIQPAPLSIPLTPDGSSSPTASAQPDLTTVAQAQPDPTAAPPAPAPAPATPAEPAENRVTPGRATRSGSSYVGIGGNFGIGDGDTDVGHTSFAIYSKIGLLRYLSARPSLLIRSDVTLLLPITYDFSFGEGPTKDLGFRAAPFVGLGPAISTGGGGKVDLLLTGGVDIPLSSRFTATAAVNATVTGDPAVGIFIGVGYNFPGF